MQTIITLSYLNSPLRAWSSVLEQDMRIPKAFPSNQFPEMVAMYSEQQRIELLDICLDIIDSWQQQHCADYLLELGAIVMIPVLIASMNP